MFVMQWLRCQLIGRRLFDRLGCQSQERSFFHRQTIRAGYRPEAPARLASPAWSAAPGLGQTHFTRPLVTGANDAVH